MDAGSDTSCDNRPVLLTVAKVALIAFLVGAVLVLAVGAYRRRRSARLDFKDATEARYGSVMAGNWTPPIENNNPTVVEETIDEDPNWPNRLR